MSTLKKFAKYILLVVVTFLLTYLLIFIGFNVNYKPIESRANIPEQITVEKAEAKKAQGRIYGKVKNTAENNLNGKYIKISIYNAIDENITTEYLKIENLKENEEKSFRANFVSENAKSYEINIVDNN